MTQRVILFNGPPGSGKDTAARYLRERFESNGIEAELLKFAGPLKDAVHRMWGLNVPADHFEARKDVPCEELGGKIPRQEYIDFSEKYAKPRYGQNHWARAGINAVRHSPARVAIFSDCGFQPEVNAMAQAFSVDNVYLFHISRLGATFAAKNDSRSYCEFVGHTPDIKNDGTYSELEEEMTMLGLQMIDIWGLRR